MLRNAKTRNRSAAPARAFTLIELLLVMFILAVLVSLVVGVGTWMIEDGKRKETEMMQAYLKCALAEYARINDGNYPPDRADASNYYQPTLSRTDQEPPGDSAGPSALLLLSYLNGNGFLDTNKTSVKQATGPYMAKIKTNLQDAFGKSMRYYLLGATATAATNGKPKGGIPLIVSAGPDGYFGDSNVKKLKDNIRSDGRASQ